MGVLWQQSMQCDGQREENARKRSLKCMSYARWAGPNGDLSCSSSGRTIHCPQRLTKKGSCSTDRFWHFEMCALERAQKLAFKWINYFMNVDFEMLPIVFVIAFACVNIRPPNDEQPSTIYVNRQLVFPSRTKSENKFKFIRMATTAEKNSAEYFPAMEVIRRHLFSSRQPLMANASVWPRPFDHKQANVLDSDLNCHSLIAMWRWHRSFLCVEWFMSLNKNQRRAFAFNRLIQFSIANYGIVCLCERCTAQHQKVI